MNASGKSYEGKGPKLKDAVQHAWENAKAEGAQPGKYKVDLAIEAENPIRGYVVVITPDP